MSFQSEFKTEKILFTAEKIFSNQKTSLEVSKKRYPIFKSGATLKNVDWLSYL